MKRRQFLQAAGVGLAASTLLLLQSLNHLRRSNGG